MQLLATLIFSFGCFFHVDSKDENTELADNRVAVVSCYMSTTLEYC